jgi:hypothetical protein
MFLLLILLVLLILVLLCLPTLLFVLVLLPFITASQAGHTDIDVRDPPVGLEDAFKRVFTQQSVLFIADMHREFEPQIAQVR